MASSSSSSLINQPSLHLSNELIHQVNVRVTGWRKAGTFLRGYDVFVLQMKLKDNQWCMYRRYSHLYEFNQKLRSDPVFEQVYKIFPPKGGLRDLYHSPDFLDERSQELNKWVLALKKALRRKPDLPEWWSQFLGGTALLDAASRGDVAAVSSLIEKGEASPFDSNHAYMTPLHAAAANGHGAVIDYLLRLEVPPDPNAFNLDGLTALHLALRSGDRGVPAAEALLQRGADLALAERSGAGHNALHLAAKFSLHLTKKILAACPRLLNGLTAGGDRRSALDLAHASKAADAHEIIKYLEAVGAEGGAAVLGRAREAQAAIKQLEEALDAAHERGDYNLQAELLVQMGDLLALDQPANAAKLYNSALYLIQTNDDSAGRSSFQSLIGDKLARVQQILVRHYTMPVRLGVSPRRELEAIAVNGDLLLRGRAANIATLREIRQRMGTQLKRAALDVRGCLSETSQAFVALFSSMLQTAITASTIGASAHGPDGKPLFAVAALGELAGQDAGPYPRVQFCIMIQNQQFVLFEFCRLLVQLFNLEAINLAETEYMALQHGTISVIPPGVALDYDGLLPGDLGEQPNLLIGSPWALAQLHLPSAFSANPNRATALLSTQLLYGLASLVERYRQEYPPLLSQQSTTGIGLLVRQKRALNEAGKWVQALKLKGFWGTKEKVKEWFELNKEVFEFLSSAILAISSFHGGRAVDVWSRIEELVEKGVFLFDAGRHLKIAYSNILHLRYVNQLHTRSRSEIVLNPFAVENSLVDDADPQPPTSPNTDADPDTLGELGPSTSSSSTTSTSAHPLPATSKSQTDVAAVQNAYRLTQDDIKNLVAVFNTAICLHKGLDHFEQAKGKIRAYDFGVMRSDSPEVVGESYFRLCLYKKAMDIMEKAVKARPQDTHLVGYVGMIWSKLGKFPKAIEYYTRALELEKKTLGPFHSTIAARYNNIAVAHKHMGNQEKAVENLVLALEVDEKQYGKSHPIIAFDHRQLGKTWKGMGDLQKALEYFETTLQIDKVVSRGEVTPAMIDDHHEIAQTLSQMDQHERALEHYQQAVELARTVYGSSAQSVAIRLTALATAFKRLDRKEESLRANQDAYQINLKAFGESHHLVARDLGNIGESFAVLGQNSAAIQHLKQSLQIYDALQFDQNHQRYVRVKRRLEQLEKLQEKESMSDEAYAHLRDEMSARRSQAVAARSDAPLLNDSDEEIDFIAAARDRKPTVIKFTAGNDNDAILDDNTFDL